jgi:hypothetical protein
MWCASGYAVAREGLKPLIAAAHQRDTDLAKLGYGE